jgi:hypothetical protein
MALLGKFWLREADAVSVATGPAELSESEIDVIAGGQSSLSVSNTGTQTGGFAYTVGYEVLGSNGQVLSVGQNQGGTLTSSS